MIRTRTLSRAVIAAVIAIAAFLAGCGPAQPVGVKALSNRADLVSGGDVLVELTLPAGATTAGLKVDVDGRDVTAAFAARDGRLRGVVEGLAVGRNRISATAEGAATGTLTVTNAPPGGPVLSGPQATPFVCATPVPQPATGDLPATNGSGLHTQARDAQCNIATEYALYYKSTTEGCVFALPDPSPTVPAFPPEPRQAVPFTSSSPPQTATPPPNGCFKPYDPAAAAPADLATTTTDAGATVPYIVRVERGVLNRGIYDLAVLYDPARPWTSLEPQPQWNGKVVFQFGFANGHPRRQVRPMIAWTDSGIGIGPSIALGRGYLVAANSMTDSMSNSNRVVMAETLMMMKEHIVERYGEIRFAVATGGSGGALNSIIGASIAPGVLDGIVLAGALPDGQTLQLMPDCALLVAAYQQPAWLEVLSAGGYTVEQINAKKAAINGHADQTSCHVYFGMFSSTAPGNYRPRFADATTGEISTLPTATNNCELPASVVYDAEANPSGVRCDEGAWAASIWGHVPGTAFVNGTRDNVGVQYGLAALRNGAITAEEFVTLNELVGGFDRDNNPTSARSVADEAALATAYRAGLVSSGRNLANVAVLDLRGWDDARGGTHHIVLSYALRDRLDQELGSHDNYVMWRFPPNPPPLPPAVPQLSMGRDALLAMDAWLTRVKADTTSASLAQKVRAARPADVADYCVLSSDTTRSIKVTDAAQCDADPFLRPAASPRQAAGGPRAGNILKCQRKPLAAAGYAPATFDAAQWARLTAVFPTGVCDWTRPGVGQQAAVSPLTFAAGPGGQQLAAQ